MSDEDQSGSSGSSPWRRRGTGSTGSSGSSGRRRARISPPTFTSGEIVAERYRIVDFIGRGGMGEIYEAEDLDLEVRVALKTVRREIADNDKALERFRREIQLARKVTHPNVCRIFDVGYYARESSDEAEEEANAEGEPFEREEIVFLTMELLEGETLSTRLKREGRLTPEEALPIVEQIAAALDAAHRAGIVHRDFKSSNIILVSDPDTDYGTRAVVTDFGLARGIAPEDSLTSSFSVSSQPVGTPTYMAPEQVAGREITPAVDIYALGVVLYEMMTGGPPFVGDSPLSTAVKRLIERPTPPHEVVSGLEGPWDEAILRCLEKDPEQRFASAHDVVRTLLGEQVAGRRTGVRSTKWLIALAVLVVVVMVGSVLWMRNVMSPAPGTSTSSSARGTDAAKKVVRRRTVAVVGFHNVTGKSDVAWLNTAFSEMLSTELGAGGKLRVIPGENVAHVKRELAIRNVDSLANQTLARVGQNLDADLLVFGAYVALGGEQGSVRVDVRIHARDGRSLGAFSVTGRESELFALVGDIGARLRENLGLASLTESEAGAVKSSQPANLAAARLYAEGIDRLRHSDALGARKRLEKAIEADPSNPLAYSALAEALGALGYDAKATEAAKRAMDLSAGLSREERLVVEGRYREATRNWDRAVEIYRALWDFFPDNLEYGLRLAEAQTAGGWGKEALETISKLRGLPSGKSDPRVDLAEARAAESLSDFRREADAASRAVTRGEARDAHFLVGEAWLAKWWALRNLGDLDKAIEASDAAKKAFDLVGDRGSMALALNAVATVDRQQGHFDEAESLDEQSLAVFREIGDKRHESWALNNLGSDQVERGEIRRALARFQESAAVAREIGDRAGVTRTLGNVGSMELELGAIDDARKAFESAYDIADEIHDARYLAWAKYNEAGALVATGRVADAARLVDEAMEEFRQIGERRGAAWTLVRRARIDLEQGLVSDALVAARDALDSFRKLNETRGIHVALRRLGIALIEHGEIDEARRRLDEARKLESAQGDTWSVALTDTAFARLELEAGNHAAVDQALVAAMKTFREQKSADHEAEIETWIAVNALRGGDFRGARAHVRKARELVHGSLDHILQLRLDVVSARVEADGSKAARERAASALESAIETAGRQGYGAIEIEARLALAEVERALGKTAVANTRLESVRAESKASGMLRVSDEVDRLLGSTNQP